MRVAQVFTRFHMVEIHQNATDRSFKYRAGLAQVIMANYPAITEVWIVERGGPNNRPIFTRRYPQPDHVAVYVMASEGKWGRAAELRVTPAGRQP
jgi:hypothetical protein